MSARSDYHRRALAVLLVLTSACASEESGGMAAAPAGPAKKAGGAGAASVEKAEAAAPASTWAYSPIGKRDPFHSYLADLDEQVNSEREHKIEETEKYELDQYRLTGLVTGTAQPNAMVEDPTGRGHVLHIGTRLGKNGGRVTRIADDAIVVTEEFRAPTGERVRLPITIKLPKPDLETSDRP
ncbi:MAG: pilus assembly protein PilP [Deltaproteobacteria bacterium]|nr:pilus assembly protein PilP [Deltaproteobacteria bacterium]